MMEIYLLRYIKFVYYTFYVKCFLEEIIFKFLIFNLMIEILRLRGKYKEGKRSLEERESKDLMVYIKKLN